MTTSPLATSTDIDASTILARVRELTEPVLRATVDRLEPWLAMMSAYHLGWRTVEGRPTPGMSGKLVRPALAVLAAEAVGADARVALPGAAAVGAEERMSHRVDRERCSHKSDECGNEGDQQLAAHPMGCRGRFGLIRRLQFRHSRWQ